MLGMSRSMLDNRHASWSMHETSNHLKAKKFIRNTIKQPITRKNLSTCCLTAAIVTTSCLTTDLMTTSCNWQLNMNIRNQLPNSQGISSKIFWLSSILRAVFMPGEDINVHPGLTGVLSGRPGGHWHNSEG